MRGDGDPRYCRLGCPQPRHLFRPLPLGPRHRMGMPTCSKASSTNCLHAEDVYDHRRHPVTLHLKACGLLKFCCCTDCPLMIPWSCQNSQGTPEQRSEGSQSFMVMPAPEGDADALTSGSYKLSGQTMLPCNVLMLAGLGLSSFYPRRPFCSFSSK